ncbi:MAG: hypothetical protein GY826_41465, partial [Fuerstiella sp.]|nr:hypothetical protein [Fuerstiella sp.]
MLLTQQQMVGQMQANRREQILGNHRMQLTDSRGHTPAKQNMDWIAAVPNLIHRIGGGVIADDITMDLMMNNMPVGIRTQLRDDWEAKDAANIGTPPTWDAMRRSIHKGYIKRCYIDWYEKKLVIEVQGKRNVFDYAEVVEQLWHRYNHGIAEFDRHHSQPYPPKVTEASLQKHITEYGFEEGQYALLMVANRNAITSYTELITAMRT